MTYLLTKVFLWLVVALVLGVFLGWLLRRFRAEATEATLIRQLDRHGSTILNLRNDLGSLRSELETKTSMLGQLDEERQRLTQQLANKATAAPADPAVAAELSRLRNELDVAQNSLTQARAAAEHAKTEAVPAIAADDPRVKELTEALESARRDNADLTQRLDRLRSLQQERDEARAEAIQARRVAGADIERLEADLARLRTDTARLQSADDERTQLQLRLEAVEAASARARDEHATTVAQLRRTIDEQLVPPAPEQPAVAEVAATPAVSAEAAPGAVDADGRPSILLSERPDSVDDLKRIKGVGPKLEQLLNSLGIYQFQQIARFAASDVEWVDQHLASFKGRIERDNWIAQADTLART